MSPIDCRRGIAKFCYHKNHWYSRKSAQCNEFYTLKIGFWAGYQNLKSLSFLTILSLKFKVPYRRPPTLVTVIVLQDFRWSSELTFWEDLLFLLEGENVHLPSPKNQFVTEVWIFSQFSKVWGYLQWLATHYRDIYKKYIYWYFP